MHILDYYKDIHVSILFIIFFYVDIYVILDEVTIFNN